MKKITDRIVSGDASPEDVDTLESVAYNIDGKTICAFGEACSWPTEAIVAKFRDELVGDTDRKNDERQVSKEGQTAAKNLQNLTT